MVIEAYIRTCWRYITSFPNLGVIFFAPHPGVSFLQVREIFLVCDKQEEHSERNSFIRRISQGIHIGITIAPCEFTIASRHFTRLPGGKWSGTSVVARS